MKVVGSHGESQRTGLGYSNDLQEVLEMSEADEVNRARASLGDLAQKYEPAAMMLAAIDFLAVMLTAVRPTKEELDDSLDWATSTLKTLAYDRREEVERGTDKDKCH